MYTQRTISTISPCICLHFSILTFAWDGELCFRCAHLVWHGMCTSKANLTQATTFFSVLRSKKSWIRRTPSSCALSSQASPSLHDHCAPLHSYGTINAAIFTRAKHQHHRHNHAFLLLKFSSRCALLPAYQSCIFSILLSSSSNGTVSTASSLVSTAFARFRMIEHSDSS